MKSSPTSVLPQATQTKRFPQRIRLVWTALGVIVLIAALAYGAMFWRQYTRPGQIHYQRGIEAAADGHFQDAEREWQAGVQQDPSFPDCYERLGDLYQALNRYPQAATNYTQAIRLRPGDGTLYKRLATTQSKAGDTKAAFAAAQKAFELLPDDGEVVGNYGILAQQMGHHDDALAALRRAHQMVPDNGRYQLSLASLEMDLALWPQAEQDLMPYLQRQPNDAWACYLAAAIYNQKPRTPENMRQATAYAERSVSNPKAPQTAFPLLSQLYLNTGRAADAERVCQVGLQHFPNYADLLAQLVQCQTRAGKLQAAAQTSQRLQAVRARQDRMGYLQLHLNNLKTFRPQDVANGLELAKLTEEDGSLPEAQKYYLSVVRHAPQDPHARAALAAFFRRTGKPEMAKQALDPKYIP